MYERTFLAEIRDKAMDLYQNNGIMPPEHLKQAMRESGVPEENFWETSQAIKILGLVEKPKIRKTKTRKFKKKLPVPTLDWKSRAAGER